MQLTVCEEMFRAATRSGWMGLLVVLLFAGVYFRGIWHTIRRQTDRVLQDAVIATFLVAIFYLHGIHFRLWWLLGYPDWVVIGQVWWNTYLRLKLSLIMVCSLGPLLLVGWTVRRSGSPIRSPGCVPGAITALVGAVILDLFILSTLFLLALRYEGNESDRLQELLRKERRARSAELANPPYSEPAARSP